MIAGLTLLLNTNCFCQVTQDLVVLADADSAYVRKHFLKNDFRLFYGGQGNNLALGSKRDDETQLNGNLYANTNDYIGLGITYKWLDGDLSFALPGTTYLKEERSNLTQLKLGISYTQRKLAFRAYYSDSKGVVVSDANNEFQSEPSLHEVKFGLHVTYLFNASKYSYRASMYQSEYQLKTAGSFLLRAEPFYRKLGTTSGSMIPPAYDLPARFGEQAGLEYIKAPGLLIFPGYGINFVISHSRFFISPVLFAGIGLARNMYKTTNDKGSFSSIEYAGNFTLNTGYNGSRHYLKIQLNWSAGYTLLNPTYLTNSNLTVLFTAGIRFRDIKGL
ncbi:MAG: DUF4421 family protein [Cyclobacteriaceae bacterium]